MNKVVAIHQPNFWPWLGYFDKIQRSDIFVFLDHVQLPKTGGTWSNRVKLLVGGEAKWATAPIDRSFRGVRAINETEFKRGDSWRVSFLGLLNRSYGKSPFYAETMEFLAPLVTNPENNIARYNAVGVLGIAEAIGISGDRFRWSSQLNTEGHSNELLISLTRQVGGAVYLCGGGASTYQDDALFLAARLGLEYQDFQHPTYAQAGTKLFHPGLSIIDALMNTGTNEVRAWLSSAAHRHVIV